MKKNEKYETMKMMQQTFYTACLFSLLALHCGCGSKTSANDENESIKTQLTSAPNEVTVMPLKRKVFEHQLVSNGKVTAAEYADLSFETAGKVARIYVKNGDRVARGQKLAELDQFKLQNAFKQAEASLAQSELELKDVLIGQGYSPSQMDKVPTDIMELAELRSGYKQNKTSYELAKYELEHAVLTAPFDGIVANLFAKEYNQGTTSESFCRIINNGRMEVDFSVLESELPLLKVGDRVSVTPYTSSNTAFNGQVTSINPVVDEQAMVRVKALIEGRPTSLFDGMNVKVSVFRSVDNAMVIPKSAVVLRSGKQVVFTLKNGKAYWNYVHTVLENMNEYTLAENGDDVLHEGDTIIVTGNVNLAHETPVQVIEAK